MLLKRKWWGEDDDTQKIFLLPSFIFFSKHKHTYMISLMSNQNHLIFIMKFSFFYTLYFLIVFWKTPNLQAITQNSRTNEEKLYTQLILLTKNNQTTFCILFESLPHLPSQHVDFIHKIFMWDVMMYSMFCMNEIMKNTSCLVYIHKTNGREVML